MVDALPEGLAELAPGPELAVVLASVDRARLGGDDPLTLLRARARQVAYEQAQLLADLVEVSVTGWDSPAGVCERMSGPDEFSPDQIAWALQWSLVTAKMHLDLARDLRFRLPAVYAALLVGHIDLARARVFHEALDGVDDAVARTIVARLIEPAGGWTPGRLRDRLRYHVHKADPGWAARRYQRAVTSRQVSRGVTKEGTAYLSGSDLPVHRAAAADEFLTRLARAAKATGDPRTLEQLRADAYLDLLTGIAFRTHPTCDPSTITADAIDQATWAAHHPHPNSGAGATRHDPTRDGLRPTSGSGSDADDDPPVDARRCCTCGGLRPGDRRGVVTLTMTMATLIGLTNDPAVIPAWGPVLADIARQVAHDHITTWQFAVTDNDGNLLHSGHTRRRPTAEALRHVQLRDRTCRAVNCRRPATTCDTDHHHDWAKGGPSEPANLGSLCRHHHRLKDAKKLTLEHHANGCHTWTTPTGRVYHVPPDHTALLTADEPLPAAAKESP